MICTTSYAYEMRWFIEIYLLFLNRLYQSMQQTTTIHNHPQPPTIIHIHPQQPTTTCNHPQPPTITLKALPKPTQNHPQPPTTTHKIYLKQQNLQSKNKICHSRNFTSKYWRNYV